MDKKAKIAQLFGDVLGGNKGGQTFLSARVVSVEGDTCTIDVDGLPVSDVRLRPTTSQGDDKILLTPAVDSFVLVGSLSGDYNNLAVLAADTLASVELTIGDTSIFIDQEGVVFNGGKLFGLVKLEPLIKKINALEKQLNDLKNVFNSWVVVPTDGGLALKAAAAAWAALPINLTGQSELENEQVKQ